MATRGPSQMAAEQRAVPAGLQEGPARGWREVHTAFGKRCGFLKKAVKTEGGNLSCPSFKV